MIDRYEKEDDEPERYDMHKVALLLWINNPEKLMSFGELKECLVTLDDIHCALSKEIAPELMFEEKEKIKYLANVFMIARMLKDGTFVITE